MLLVMPGPILLPARPAALRVPRLLHLLPDPRVATGRRALQLRLVPDVVHLLFRVVRRAPAGRLGAVVHFLDRSGARGGHGRWAPVGGNFAAGGAAGV